MVHHWDVFGHVLADFIDSSVWIADTPSVSPMIVFKSPDCFHWGAVAWEFVHPMEYLFNAFLTFRAIWLVETSAVQS